MSKKKKLKRIMELCNYSILSVNEIDNYFAFKVNSVTNPEHDISNICEILRSSTVPTIEKINEFSNMEECKRKLYQNPETLNKYVIGCDPAISGEDKTVEYFVKLDGTKFKVSQDGDSEIMDRFRKEYGINSKPIYGKSPLIGFAEANNNLKRAKEAFAKSQDERSRAILNAIDAMKEFSNTLNELKKKKAMKITEETKIKDLIPEGYEFDPESPMEYFKTSCNVTIPVKKKEVKDFKWYVDRYLTEVVNNTISDHIAFKTIEKLFFRKEYDSTHFEFKIGLLKFICDDCGVKWWNFAKNYATKEDLSKSFYQKVIDICPAEFLNSIFK